MTVKDFILWHGIDRYSCIYIRRLDWSNIQNFENIHNRSISKQCMEQNWRFKGSKKWLICNFTWCRIFDRRRWIWSWQVSELTPDNHKYYWWELFAPTHNFGFLGLRLKYGISKLKLLKHTVHFIPMNIGIRFCSLSIRIFASDHWKIKTLNRCNENLLKIWIGH